MKNDIVECVHWDPEVDPALQATRKKNSWVLLAGALAVLAVAVGVSLWLFLPRGEPLPVEPTTDAGQISVGQTEDGMPAQSQPASQDDPVLAQGIEYYNSGNYGAALNALNQAIAVHPDSGAAYTYRGLTQYVMGNYQAAIQDFTQAMRRMEPNADLTLMRGTAYYTLGLYPESIGDLTRAIELNPGSGKAYEARALAYDATGRMDLAAADRAAAVRAGIGG